MATAGGFCAILLWSTTVAVSRSLAEQVGPLAAAAAVYAVSGAISLFQLARSGERRRLIISLPRNYLAVCGMLFISYMLFLFLAVGLAAGRRQVLEVALLNYLWPALTLLFLAALPGHRTRPAFLAAGSFLAITGVFLVLTEGSGISWNSFLKSIASGPAACSLGLSAAVTWALYSVLTRKWAGGSESGAVDLFLPATGAVFILLCLLSGETRAMSFRPAMEAVFLGAATYAGYALWDQAMRLGSAVAVTAASYLTPFFSTVASCLYLGVIPGPGLWWGCGMLITGSFLSWLSVKSVEPVRQE
jgi:drug/metabolite transporter (DMT)-like permease